MHELGEFLLLGVVVGFFIRVMMVQVPPKENDVRGVFTFCVFDLAHGSEVVGILAPMEAGVFLLVGFERVKETDGGFEELQGVADGRGVDHHGEVSTSVTPGELGDVSESGIASILEVPNNQGVFFRGFSGNLNGGKATVIAKGE